MTITGCTNETGVQPGPSRSLSLNCRGDHNNSSNKVFFFLNLALLPQPLSGFGCRCLISAQSSSATFGTTGSNGAPSRTSTIGSVNKPSLSEMRLSSDNAASPSLRAASIILQFAFSATNPVSHVTTTTTMKFFFAAAAALVAVANAADCDLTKLLPLTSDANVLACSKATGFTPPVLPAKEKWPSLCANTDCQTALSKLKALGLGDCTALGVALESGLITPIETFCKSSTTPAPTTSTPSAASPTPATSAPGTTTPSVTTVKPAC